jgi:hypothetical protein
MRRCLASAKSSAAADEDNTMRAALKYMEERHGDDGAAWFVVPVLLFAGALAGVGDLLAWMGR